MQGGSWCLNLTRMYHVLAAMGLSAMAQEKISTRESAAHAVVAHYEHFKKAEVGHMDDKGGEGVRQPVGGGREG